MIVIVDNLEHTINSKVKVDAIETDGSTRRTRNPHVARTR